MRPRVSAAPRACPCDSGRAYTECCEPWHHGPRHLQAPDAVTLMRSRYSAFVLDAMQYLLDTWHPDTRPARLTPNPADLKWLGLQVRQHIEQDAEHASVEFVARYRQTGRATRLHETSRFVRRDNRWFYLDGQQH
ncbi:MAG TPA: YchJ family metal-binding protein [Bordetella sp.]|nr:YchJ family metal-binding protein [Bordetella sp.]